jgi:hypothetical protein
MAAYDHVVLFDRAGQGGCTIVYDGAYLPIKPGQTEVIVPVNLAEWLFRSDQQKVHTTDGEYVQRFGVKQAPEDFYARIGGPVDNSPITIDTNRVEGWDTDQFAPERGAAAIKHLKRNPADYANVATPGGFGNER